MNWKSLIQELRAAGWTQVQIAAEVGVKQPTIAGLAAGTQKTVRWEVGEKLIGLRGRTPELAQPAPAVAEQEGA